MKKFMFLVVPLMFSVQAFAGDTDAVFSCYKQSNAGADLPDGELAVRLCANVKNDSDIKAVFSCYKQSNAGADLPNGELAAQLCANVKN